MRRRPGRSERGAAAVELAIVLPLLLLFIGGIVDFGRYFMVEIQLTNAAREGARMAAISQNYGDAKLRAEAAIGDNTVPGLNVSVGACAGTPAQTEVTATGDFEWILLGPAMSMVGGGPAALPEARSTAVMRCEI